MGQAERMAATMQRATTLTATEDRPQPVVATPLLGIVPGIEVNLSDIGDDVQVWSLDTDLVGPDELQLVRRWLDPAEVEQAGAYVRAELRTSYESAHAVARSLMGSLLGVEPADVVWGRHACPGCGESHGRPLAVGAPVEFSLAHTPGLVLVAMSRRAVGVDVERVPDAGSLGGMSAVLHPDEAIEIDAAAGADEASIRFTRAWTRTEAYLKGLGIGLGRDPDLDYLGTGPETGRQLDGWLIRDVEVSGEFGAAVATVID